MLKVHALSRCVSHFSQRTRSFFCHYVFSWFLVDSTVRRVTLGKTIAKVQQSLLNFLKAVLRHSGTMWPFSAICQAQVRLDGKTVVITGANSGIGKETARTLYWQGARVILACRDAAKARAAIEDLKKTPPSRADRKQFAGGPGELVVYKLDLCSFQSVREFVQLLNDTEPHVHILINNAGVMLYPFSKTEDGFETHLQANYLGHFLLTLLLLPKLVGSAPSRIVNVASMVHTTGAINFDDINLETSYSAWRAYAQSKLANVLFSRELARRLQAKNIQDVTTYSLHPGVIHTELRPHFDSLLFPGSRALYWFLGMLFLKTQEQGAQTTLHCATDEEAGKESGLYYRECAAANSASVGEDVELEKRLWDESIKMVHLENYII